MKYIYTLSFFVVFLCLVKGQSNIDSLQKVITKSTDVKAKCDALNELALSVINEDPDKAAEYANQAKILAKKSNYKDGEAFAIYNLGNIAYYEDDYENGLKLMAEAEIIFNGTQNKKGLGYVLNTRGEILTLEGEYSAALTALFAGMKHFEEIKDNVGISRVDINIGTIHYYQKNYSEAIKYFNQALTTADEVRKGDATLFLGKVYVEQDNYAEAKKYLLIANEIGTKNNDNYIISDCLYLLGEIDVFYGDRVAAEKKFLRSLEIQTELENFQGICICSNQLGLLRLNSGDAKSALTFFKKAYEVSVSKGIKEETKLACLGMSNAYNFLKSYDSAYQYLKLNNKVNEELLSEEASKKLAELEASLAAQKKEAAFEAERKLQSFTKKVLIYCSIGIILVMIVISLIIYNRYKLKQKANLKLEAFNNEIKHQRDIIEEKQKEILDSINYAKRIQTALLASEKVLKENMKEYFIFFRPKDIVSGDFYWASVLANNTFAVVTADSTGHGVPGAIMSMLNIACLNETVSKGATSPDVILSETRTKIIGHLANDGSAEGGKDGMDCSLVAYDFVNKKITCAAANNPVWIVRNAEVIEVKPDKMPVGKHDKDKIPFTLHELDVQVGDVVYTFTDGFGDQFGGPQGKKFMHKKLKELIVNMHTMPLSQQLTVLDQKFFEWKGDLEQVDDVLVIGVKIV